MTIILALMYPLAVQYERGGWWLVLAPFTFIVLVLDIVANYTELALFTWDFPRQYEYTFSTRLVRLRRAPGWRGVVCSKVANILDALAPGGRHIK
jgi:hypothetical protein